mmetsp:Transcript_16767/g.54835  ORF Transcript_16767/g.54835 Transcript_16767/m.54835 type:complete len:205 (-) Transcript_16767:139-753(-)|eukprot:CAMPEP_0170141492 /NCGR_PEP_ID=MMETSP0033_2-20121228/7034_1 /TAXON_ID=195969 /ORGANISM="Dolichomastix tenuilepis, Strain CCMP3274" /LENGTH=204 /DNA_ID=CAMNT_0010377761 /DNA_START=129 /DNA_END=743 /DNA_ORIENTATION=-
MSAVNILDVVVLDNPSTFSNPLQFEVQYECLYDLKNDLEWKIVYVGSAEDEQYDQVLDSVLVGPMTTGSYRFLFQADPPDPSRIPAGDILGVTVVLLTCSYNDQEFLRVGYYVNNEYMDEELRENPPAEVRVDRIARSILADKPRLTKFDNKFDQVDEGVVVVGGPGDAMEVEPSSPPLQKPAPAAAGWDAAAAAAHSVPSFGV